MSPCRPAAQLLTRTATARLAVAAAAALIVVGPLLTATSTAAAAPTVASGVVLGRAAGFSALAGPSIANTGAGTVLALDLGVTGTLAGFPPGTVTGTTRVTTPEVEAAHEDRQAAYDSVVAQTGGTAFGGDLAGTTFTPGLYSTAAAVTNSGTIILDAADDPSAIFVFQIGGALSSAASTKVVLTNGALANNVYWQAAGAVTLGANAKWAGTILAGGVISFGEAASLKGRALTSSTMALANSPITKPIDDLVAPVVTLNGGSARSTRDTTPPVSGTTDEPGMPVVTVAIGSQVLTTRARAGAWTLSADALAEGLHTVVASVTDPSGNTGTATQQLTIDAEAPGVTVLGGTRAATSDTTPSISGTTTEPDATVSVTVGDQTLTTVASAGAWTVEAAALTETAHLVLASVDDAAGNTGSASQVLTVDLTVPVLVIDGGPTRSTTDTSPWTYGTTAEPAGTVVKVTVGGQSLTATVNPGGTWGVSAEAIPVGTYAVEASITDAALNKGTAHQTLVVAPPGEVPAPTPTSTPTTTPTTTTPTTTPTPTPTNPTPTSTPTPSPTEIPPTAAAYRPDAEIRRGRGRFVGAEVYTVADQRVAATLRGRTRRVSFQVRVTNQGDTAEKLQLVGTRATRAFRLTYVVGSKDVSAAVVDGRYLTETLGAGRSMTVTVTVTRLKRAKPGTTTTMSVRTVSTHAPGRSDAVSARVTVAG